MKNATLTDAAYEMIDRIEQKQKMLWMTIIGLISLAIFGFATDAYLYLVFSHQKGGISDISTFVMSALMLLCLFVSAIALKRLVFMRRLGNNINRFKMFEETVYDEVLKSVPD